MDCVIGVSYRGKIEILSTWGGRVARKPPGLYIILSL
jgi:hypothetical protein